MFYLFENQSIIYCQSHRFTSAELSIKFSDEQADIAQWDSIVECGIKKGNLHKVNFTLSHETNALAVESKGSFELRFRRLGYLSISGMNMFNNMINANINIKTGNNMTREDCVKSKQCHLPFDGKLNREPRYQDWINTFWCMWSIRFNNNKRWKIWCYTHVSLYTFRGYIFIEK